MAKYTQTIRRQFADELFECVWPFCGIGSYRAHEDFELHRILTTKLSKYYTHLLIVSFNYH